MKNKSCGRHVPPSFARTRRRAEGQNTSTAEETRHIHSLTFGRSFLSFLVFTFHCKSLGSQAYLMISSIHLLMFSRLSFVSNDKLRTAVSTRAPAISAAMAVQACKGTAILLIVIHFSYSAALIHDATAAPAVFFFATFRSSAFVTPSIVMFLCRFSLICQVVRRRCASQSHRSGPPGTQSFPKSAVFPEFDQFSPETVDRMRSDR